MSIQTFFPRFIAGLLLLVLFTSCFKDVDFSQTEDIQITPDIDVDIIYYDLNKVDFLDSDTGEFTAIIRDTVRLEYLDDSYIQDGLTYAEFRFRHENSFPYEIRSELNFLNARNRKEFDVNYIIPAGSDTVISVIDTIHIVQGSNIDEVKNSIELAVELELLEPSKSLEGNLKFLSKGLFRLTF
ncbi:hypothetical protein [Christiangramia portivictoriae]|uniref:hypothetical protein n=1 Tax=Christiangramia portivictoriae TaxID=326069 RepID=UPI00040514F2|nr:hypothetical protein [Christiangramia portivictoriae]